MNKISLTANESRVLIALLNISEEKAKGKDVTIYGGATTQELIAKAGIEKEVVNRAISTFRGNNLISESSPTFCLLDRGTELALELRNSL